MRSTRSCFSLWRSFQPTQFSTQLAGAKRIDSLSSSTWPCSVAIWVFCARIWDFTCSACCFVPPEDSDVELWLAWLLPAGALAFPPCSGISSLVMTLDALASLPWAVFDCSFCWRCWRARSPRGGESCPLALAVHMHAATAKTRIGLQIVLMGRLSLAARRRTAPVNGIRHGLQLRVTNGPCTSGQEGQLRLDYQTIKS